MDITVKMTPEEYDLFRRYQLKKDFFEQRPRRGVVRMRRRENA